MALSVGVAQPGTISSVGVATPPQITSVGNNYGFQEPVALPIQGSSNVPAADYSNYGTLGYNTAYVAPNPGYTAPNGQWYPSQAAYTTATQGTINNIYDQLAGSIQQTQGSIDRQTDIARQGITDQYGATQASLQSGRQLGTQNLQTAMNRVGENQKLSLRDLGNSIRNAFDAANVYLGTRGAGDSSAAGMYGVALARMQDRGRSDMLRQSNQQYQDIDLKQAELENNYTSATRDLDVWRNTQLNQIASQYLAQQDALRREMTNANAERQRALASLGVQLANDSLSRISQLNGAAENYLQRLNLDRTQAQQALATGNQMGQVNYAPTALQRPDLPLSMQANAATGGQAAAVNPLFPLRPRDEERPVAGV